LLVAGFANSQPFGVAADFSLCRSRASITVVSSGTVSLEYSVFTSPSFPWTTLRWRLWDRQAEEPASDAKENVIVLSEAFWNEVRAHPIPLNRDIVRAFTHAPGTLDFYMWLAWRSYKLSRVARIPLFGRNGLSAQLGAAEYGRERDFRRTVSRWIAEVRPLWPECPARLSADGKMLLIGRTRRQVSQVGDRFRPHKSDQN
jgi:hypothetical protein